MASLDRAERVFSPTVKLTVGCLISAGASTPCLRELGCSRSDPLAISAAQIFHRKVDV